MFKGSGQINPQGLRNDYSGFERAAAIKQQTMAGIGKAIKEGHEKIVKKKKDAAVLESGRVLMGQVAESAGFKIDKETLDKIAKGADQEFMKNATETMAKLGEWGQKQAALMAQQKKEVADRIAAAKIVATAKVNAAKTLATAQVDAAGTLATERKPGELRDETEFRDKQGDRGALSKVLSASAQKKWSLKRTMKVYHKSGGKDDEAVYDAYVKMNPNMQPEIAKVKDEEGNTVELVLWNGQMRSMSDLTKEQKLSAVETTLAASTNLTKEKKQEIRNFLATNLGTDKDSEAVKLMRIVFDRENGGQGGPVVRGPTRTRSFYPKPDDGVN